MPGKSIVWTICQHLQNSNPLVFSVNKLPNESINEMSVEAMATQKPICRKPVKMLPCKHKLLHFLFKLVEARAKVMCKY